jgi:hypothetical protein
VAVLLVTLPAVPEETQSGERSPDRLGACDESALGTNWVTGERQPNRGDARRRVTACVVRHQSVRRVRFLEEILERVSLKRIEC